MNQEYFQQNSFSKSLFIPLESELELLVSFATALKLVETRQLSQYIPVF